MNFIRDGKKIQRQMRRRPTVRPLGGAEVLVAVRGPSPGEGGGKNILLNKDLLLLIGCCLSTDSTEAPLRGQL